MIKTAAELATACLAVAGSCDTLYVLGCFGWPMTKTNRERALRAQSFNNSQKRREKIDAADENTFGFDCVNLIKALLWGWSGETSHVYGGADYGSNGVPDLGADQMLEKCGEVSEDFSDIQTGEVLWKKGHIGVYVGDGLAVECTYRWEDGVQVTAVGNLGGKAGYHERTWTKHGKLPYVTYETKEEIRFTMEMRNLKKGCSGEDVRALQLLLAGNGYDLGTAGADGIFGTKTDTAVRAYQTAKKLTSDGIAGKNTMSALLGVSIDG